MELVNGRPENEEGRLDKEIRVYDLLDSLGVKYQRIDHEAAMTMEACEEIDRTLSEGEENGVAICKNLFLCNRQATDFYLLLIPGDKPFKTKYLSAQIGYRIFPAVLRKAGVYGEISGHYTGIGEHYGTDERPREEGSASDR